MNKRLKELRKALKMTQAEFAAKLEMAQNSYSKIELGDNSLTDKNIFLICLIYGVNETWLRTGEGDMFDSESKAKGEDEQALLHMFRLLSPEMRAFVLRKIDECLRLEQEFK
jgi:transcriptional regulator with XRE-family HTH domain